MPVAEENNWRDCSTLGYVLGTPTFENSHVNLFSFNGVDEVKTSKECEDDTMSL